MFARMLFACACFAASAAQAQPAVIPLSTPVEQLAREALGTQPGMAMAAAWRGGKASFAGVAAGGGVPAPVTSGPDATLFEIGSISKVFTATAVVQLADRGRLNLQTDVNRYLKKLKVPATFPEPVTPSSKVTV